MTWDFHICFGTTCMILGPPQRNLPFSLIGQIRIVCDWNEIVYRR